MDHLACDLKLDPHAFRVQNLYVEGDTTHFDQPLKNWHISRCIDQVYESGEYAARMLSIQKFNSEHRYKKRGMALVPTKFGISFTAKFMNQGGALVHVHTDGTVLVSHGGTEMGQGLHTKVDRHIYGIVVVVVVVGVCGGIYVLMEFVSLTFYLLGILKEVEYHYIFSL
jgi:xanthine dehydrogenase/oxidase